MGVSKAHLFNITSYTWYSSSQLDEISYWGYMGFYSGNGYVVDIPSNNPAIALQILDRLFVCSLLLLEN
jgi:hypothetical protein